MNTVPCFYFVLKCRVAEILNIIDSYLNNIGKKHQTAFDNSFILYDMKSHGGMSLYCDIIPGKQTSAIIALCL